jgi:hypothetical protein
MTVSAGGESLREFYPTQNRMNQVQLPNIYSLIITPGRRD